MVFNRVVPDTDFETEYQIPGYPVIKKLDSDIRPGIRYGRILDNRPDVRLLKRLDTGYPAG